MAYEERAAGSLQRRTLTKENHMHKVELRKGFTGERRNRAGISVTRADAYVGELTDEQLVAIKADPELVVSASKSDSKAPTAKRSGAERKMTDKAKKG